MPVTIERQGEDYIVTHQWGLEWFHTAPKWKLFLAKKFGQKFSLVDFSITRGNLKIKLDVAGWRGKLYIIGSHYANND